MTRWTAFHVRRTEPRLRLFCLPYAGGGANLFRGWDELLPEEIEIRPVELPGRGTRLGEPAVSDMGSLVRHMAEGLEPLIDLPYAILGIGMGALAGFELSRTLRSLHYQQPAALLAVAQNAPSAALERPPASLMSDEKLRAALHRHGGMSEEALGNPRLMRLFLPVLRADYSIVDTYSYRIEKPLHCPIDLFVGTNDPSISSNGIQGWQQETFANATMHHFAGNHFFFRNNQRLFLAAVSSRLRELV